MFLKNYNSMCKYWTLTPIDKFHNFNNEVPENCYFQWKATENRVHQKQYKGCHHGEFTACHNNS